MASSKDGPTSGNRLGNMETGEAGRGLRRIASPHDRLFRRVLANPARAAVVLRAYLPKTITDRLSEDPPRLVDGSFGDPALRAHQSDLLFEVTLMTGTPVLVYALLEHKSTPDPLTPLQVEEYTLRIWRRRIDDHPDDTVRLPPILALIFYHGERPWTVPRSISEMIADDASIRALTRLRGIIGIMSDPTGFRNWPPNRTCGPCFWRCISHRRRRRRRR